MYLFHIAAQVLPSKLPDNVQEMFLEAIKALAATGDLNYQPSIEYSSYTQDTPVANTGDVSVALATAVYVVSNVNLGSFFYWFRFRKLFKF